MQPKPASSDGRLQDDLDVTSKQKYTGEHEDEDIHISKESEIDHLSETSNKPEQSKPVLMCNNILYSKDKASVTMNEGPSIDEVSLGQDVTNKPRPEPNRWKWVILAAAFIISVCIEGVALSFGLLREEFSTQFKDTQARTSLIGSLFIAIPLLTGPIMSAFVDRCGCRATSVAAGLVTTIAFLLAAVSYSARALCVTIGVIGGLGVAVLYVTSHISVALWFHEKQNWIVRLFCCSYSIGPIFFLPMLQFLLKHYRLSDAMVMVGGILLHICVCGALMRNRQSGKKNKTAVKLLKKTKSVTSTCSLTSKYITSESESSSRSEVAIELKHETECNAEPAVLPVRIKPKEATPSIHSQNDVENNNPKIIKSNLNENSNKGESKKTQILNKCRAMFSDHNYLKGITLYKNNLVCRGAMTSIPKYKLRSTLRPDVYNNSNWSLNSDAGRENIPRLNIWMSLEITSDDIPMFCKIHFIMFNLCLFNTSAWSIFPYFFLKSLMDMKMVDGGISLISVIALATVIGTATCSWAQEQPWMKAIVTHRTCLFLCGLSLLSFPLSIHYYGILVFVSIVFGFTLGFSQSLTTTILMDLMPMNKFSMAYCVVLMAQGIGCLVGAPLGGMLYDLTGAWDATFWLGGVGIIVAGICACFVKVSQTFREDFGSGFL